MRLYIFSILVIVFFSGCSAKIYQAPVINIVLRDAETNKPVEGVKLHFFVDTAHAKSNSDGEINFDGIYETRWHAYPFPIPSRGAYIETSFRLLHPDYNRYELSCGFTSLGGRCGPSIRKIDQGKKELVISCDGCYKAKDESYN